MGYKSSKNPLEFTITERHVKKKSFFFGELVKLRIKASKPIPPAIHGTIRLVGKLRS